MIDELLERIKKAFEERYSPIMIIYLLLFCIIFVRVFNIQIAENEKLWSDTEEKTLKVRELKSARGNILDRNGVLLAYNELSYSITLEDTGSFENSTEKNAMLHKLITIIEGYGGTLANDFFIKLDADGNLYFDGTEKEELRFKRDAYSKKSVDELTEEERNATPEDVYEFLRDGKGNKSTSMFYISNEEYTVEEVLKIMQLRYYLMLNKYQKYNPITVAYNVNTELVAAINEYSSDLPGVDVLVETYRVYNDSEEFAHMMGYTGMINNEELEELNTDESSEYSATDQIGKTGLEEYLEPHLHGKKGSETLVIGEDGEVEEITDVIQPIAGSDVYLTIDSTLQKASYTLIEKKLASILLSKIVNKKEVGTFKDAKDITIPIYDAYYNFINNNLIDIDELEKDNADTYEKTAYKKYVSEIKEVKNLINSKMAYSSTQGANALDDTTNAYLDRIYEILKEKGILITDEIDKEDSKYKSYVNGDLSLSKFLQHAFSCSWINLNKLGVEENSYYSTSELYSILLKYVIENVENDRAFKKCVYVSLIEQGEITGSQLCIILMEQGTIKKNDSDMSKLKSGSLSAYKFVMNKLTTLELTPAQLSLDPCSGSVVVTDVKTGDVLAMVTYPSYDNNELANSINSTYYRGLLEDESDVLVNRTTQTLTAPGSTFKMVSSAAGLEEGVITPSSKITDKVKFTKIGNPPSCHSKYGHGSINVVNALGHSCNYFYYEVGYRLGSVNGKYDTNRGLTTLKKYASMFGFDNKSGVEISEYTPKISTEDAVRSAIGQGNNAYAPIQIARYVTSIANSGTVYNLTLVDKIKDTATGEVNDNKATVYNNIDFKDSTWDSIHDGMYHVVNVNSNSLRNLYKDLGVTVAGKTGTAQQVKTRGNHALFVSFAPYETPEIAVTSVIQFGYSSSNAADLASQVYQYYFELTDTDVLIDSDVTASDIDTSQQD